MNTQETIDAVINGDLVNVDDARQLAIELGIASMQLQIAARDSMTGVIATHEGLKDCMVFRDIRKLVQHAERSTINAELLYNRFDNALDTLHRFQENIERVQDAIREASEYADELEASDAIIELEAGREYVEDYVKE